MILSSFHLHSLFGGSSKSHFVPFLRWFIMMHVTNFVFAIPSPMLCSVSICQARISLRDPQAYLSSLKPHQFWSTVAVPMTLAVV